MNLVVRAVLAALLMHAGCGGGSREPREPAPAVLLEPVDISVRATRVGGSVRLDITGEGRRRPEGHAMENPDNWQILATANGHTLKRMVNGSVRVSRYPVGRARSGVWDITVAFAVAFAVPEDALEIALRIHAPDSEPFETTVHVDPPSAGDTARKRE